MSQSQRMAYIGVKPCGCVVRCCADDEYRREEVVRWVNDAVRDGLGVTYVPLAKATKMLKRCDCDEVDEESWTLGRDTAAPGQGHPDRQEGSDNENA